MMRGLFSVAVLWLRLNSAEAAQLRRSPVIVRKPRTDRRTYSYATLANGLRALAVRDPRAAKSAFAVAVSAGSFYDPPDLPGLAHFCEHLLFLGTRKYPDEASFDAFLSRHDGSSNAYTEQERTVFYNEVSHAGFDEGMDRFAQFFIAPLFKQEMVGRELDAVNSEHMKNIPNMNRRLWELMRSTARNTSVVNRFYTGTTESLRHGDNYTVAALKRYHTENYCAPRMSLVVISNRSIEDQLRLAHNHFGVVSRVGCSSVPRDFGEDYPFADKSARGRFIRFRSDSSPQLWMMFPLPPTLKDYKAQPSSMLEYALGYAGPRSLKSELRDRNLISNLDLQVDQSSAATLVLVMLHLTDSGSKEAGNVTQIVFDYLARLRAQTQGVVKSVYPTMQAMSAVSFDYQEAPDDVRDLVSSLAAAMTSYAPADILSGDATIDSMDNKLVERLLQQLTPANVNLALSTRDFDEQREANRLNQWYGLRYADGLIPEQMSNQWGAHVEGVELQMPPALKYVPTNLEVLTATAGRIPRRSLNATTVGSADVWWLGRGVFALPKAVFRLRLAVPKTLSASAEYTALRRLHVEVSKHELEEPMEDIVNCGLDWDLTAVSSGYELKMGGYSQHLPSVMAQVARGFTDPPSDPRRFAQVKQKLLDALEDATSTMPYAHALEALSAISTSGVFGRAEVARAMRLTDYDAFAAYLATLRASGLRLQLLATGNVDESATHDLAKRLVAELGLSRVLSRDEAFQSHAVRAERPIEVRMPNPIVGDPNSAIVNSYQYGVPDIAERVKLLIIGKMFAQPVFDTLRTKEQLGYVVFGDMMPHLNTLELNVIVQGAKEFPDEVDSRIEAVLDDFMHSLTHLKGKEFTQWKASLRSAIGKEADNMDEEADRFWTQIQTDEECFDRRALELEFLDSSFSPAELAKEFETFRGTRARKVSVRLFGSGAVSAGLLPNSSAVAFATGRTGGGGATTVSTLAAASPGASVVVYENAITGSFVVPSSGHNYWPSAGICHVRQRGN